MPLTLDGRTFYSPLEVAERVGLSRCAVYRLLERGKLPFVPRGREKWISARVVSDVLPGLAVAAAFDRERFTRKDKRHGA